MSDDVWTSVLDRLRSTMDPDEYRRWFASSYQASDSGDQITVWVPSATDGRHISVNYLDLIHRELERLERSDVAIRFVATGYEDDAFEE